MTTAPADSPTATTNVPGGGAPADTDGHHFAKTTAGQIVVGVLGVIAFLYFARPVILPVFLACAAAMTLKPLIRWAPWCRIPPAISSAALLLVAVVAGLTFTARGSK